MLFSMQSCREAAILCMEYTSIAMIYDLFLPSDFAPYYYFNFNEELSRMKYVKADCVFPQSLLAEIQKYVQGELVYIPKLPANYETWGTNTDTKSVIEVRNKDIVQAFKAGTSISELAQMYYLSEETIKKIVYRKNI